MKRIIKTTQNETHSKENMSGLQSHQYQEAGKNVQKPLYIKCYVVLDAGFKGSRQARDAAQLAVIT